MSDISLPMELDTIHDELESIKRIVDKWESFIKSKPLPSIDAPGDRNQLELLFISLRNEIRLAGRKCEALAEVFDDL